MNIVSQILGWAAILAGVIAFAIQSVTLAYIAIAVGVVSLFFKNIRGMGVTGIGFGIVAWLMVNIFS